MFAAITPNAPRPSLFVLPERDILAELLRDKRSPNTRRAYQRDLKDFFGVISNGLEPTPQLVGEFLQLERATAIALVLGYKGQLMEKGLAEATVNRRLAAIKSLVSFAALQGKCIWSLEEISGEKVQTYRDTSGVTVEQYRTLLEVPDRETLKGKRDYAILRLLWDNALRRGELNLCNVADFSPDAHTLSILGKGRGTQKETVSLSAPTIAALVAWLAARHEAKPESPLFIALDHASFGHRLTGTSIYEVVSQCAKKAGIQKQMSPHRCRHSSITAALDATNGNVREVQKLSRHKKVETLLIYDSHRENFQGKVTGLLSGLLD